MAENAALPAKPRVDISELGRYRIQEVLGRGAMGVVYKAYDPIIDRDVAIKTIRLDVSVDQDEKLAFYERFFREAQTAGKLSHPNIVTIHDIGEDKGVTFIAMELIEGVSLQHYVDHPGSLTLLQILEVLREVALGLDYAHGKGIVHRDVKPANVMVLKDDRVKVTDFGIAKISTASALTSSGVFLGSPNYMSPEQVTGKQLDGRSDIFSLGTVLYELLTGKKPFQGDHVAATIYNVANLKPPSPRELNPDVPASVNRVVKQAMQKNPEARYATARELADEISAVLAELGVTRAAPVQPDATLGPAAARAASEEDARRLPRVGLQRRLMDVAAGALGASLFFLVVLLLTRGGDGPKTSAGPTPAPAMTATIADPELRAAEERVLRPVIPPRKPLVSEPPPRQAPSTPVRPQPTAEAPSPAPTPSTPPRETVVEAPATPVRVVPTPVETVVPVAVEATAAPSPVPASLPPETPPPVATPEATPAVDPRSQEVRQAALLNDYIERLQNATTYKARLDAADNLASLGDSRAVPYLQYSAQNDGSAFVRSRCRKILKDAFGVEVN